MRHSVRCYLPGAPRWCLLQRLLQALPDPCRLCLVPQGHKLLGALGTILLPIVLQGQQPRYQRGKGFYLPKVHQYAVALGGEKLW